MIKKLKFPGIILLMFFSFYYTEKVALYAQNNTPLKKDIIVFKNNNKVPSVNAEVKGNFITPGLNGLEVNVEKSYSVMKVSNVFNEKNVIYDEVKPKKSISNYKDKIINHGNPNKNAVSLILDENSNLFDYFSNNRITFDYIENTKYCFYDSNCNNKQKIKPTIYLNSQNFYNLIKNIEKGSIIYIDSSINEWYINVLIKTINYNGLNILHLNEHLSENNHL